MVDSELFQAVARHGEQIGKLDGITARIVGDLGTLLERSEKTNEALQEIKIELEKGKGRAIGQNKRIGDIEEDLETEVMPVIEDYKRKKLIGIGAIIGAGGAGGGLGAFLYSILQKLGIV